VTITIPVVSTSPLSFYYGSPDPDAFPTSELLRAMEHTLEHHVPAALLYGPEQGPALLLEEICGKVAREEGLSLSSEQVFISAGASQALDIVCRLWARPGDVVLVGAPTYHEALALLRDYPIRLESVPLDDEGIDAQKLESTLLRLSHSGARVAFLYAIPTFQNPSGVTMTLGRRKDIIALARQHGLWLVEDDVYRDLCFEGTVPPSLFELGDGESVLRLGSFSKILAPGLRLGWVMAEPSAIARLAGAGLRLSAGGANPFAAYVVAEFCRAGHLEQHVQKLVNIYRARRDMVLDLLASTMPSNVTWSTPQGGFHVWLTLPETLYASQVAQAALQNHVRFLPGDAFFVDGNATHNIRLPFSYLQPEDIDRGLHLLARIIRSHS
jgi:2-aminoadipate transaminase